MFRLDRQFIQAFSFFAFSLILIVFTMLYSTPDRAVVGLDFRAMYTGGMMLSHGVSGNFYDLKTQYHWQEMIFPDLPPKALMPFVYPPFVAIIFVPVTFVSLSLAYQLFAVVNTCLFLFITYLLIKRLFPGKQKNLVMYMFLFVLFYFPVLQAIWQGQLTFFLFAGFIFSWYLFKKDKPFLSGMALSLLLFRPHLILLPLLLLVWKKQGRALLGFTALSGLLFMISFFLVGWQGLISYINLLLTIPSFGEAYTVHPQLEPTLRGFLQIIFQSDAFSVVFVPYFVGSVFLTAVAGLVWKGTWKPSSEKFDLQWAILSLAIIATSMHTNYHDLVLLLFPCLVVFTHLRRKVLFFVTIVSIDLLLLFFFPLPSLLLPFLLFFFWVLVAFTKEPLSSSLLRWSTLIFVLLFCLFWFKGVQFVDPDFGWHVRMGKLILTSGIPATDPFSYTMPSYPFVDHEWLLNVLLVKGFRSLGQISLAFLFSIIAISALYFSSLTIPKQARRFLLIPLFLSGMILVNFIGVRTQVVTWAFFSGLLFILRDPRMFDRWGWVIPLIFIVWANLHGGFPVGMVALLLFVFVRIVFKKRVLWNDIFIFVVSFAATFCTPYHWRLWWEVGMQITDGGLRWRILEWMPGIFFSIMTLWAFVVLSLVFVWKARKQFFLFDLLLYGGLFVAGLSSIRHIPLWIFVAFPMTAQGLAFFAKKVETIPFALSRLRKVLIGFFLLCCLLALFDLQGMIVSLFQKKVVITYPDQAVSYLHTHPPKGKLFSTYNWGGYLIWKLPEQKVFIDGRMPSWRRDPVDGESAYAFFDYQKFLSGELSFSHVVKQYRITTILIPSPKKEKKTPFLDRLDHFSNQFFHLPLPEKDPYAILRKTLREKHWYVVYQDKTAVIYQQ